MSAGAAIVQAVGALLAIAVSIQLARSSAKREKEADAAATRRAEGADQAATSRAIAAERAADERVERGRREQHNNLIDRILSITTLAIDECKSELNGALTDYSDTADEIQGGFVSRHLTELAERLPALKQETFDVSLIQIISKLQDSAARRRIIGTGGKGYAAALQSYLNNVKNAAKEMADQRQ